MSDEFDFAAAAAIRKVAEDWAVLRDAGRWEEFARVWLAGSAAPGVPLGAAA